MSSFLSDETNLWMPVLTLDVDLCDLYVIYDTPSNI